MPHARIDAGRAAAVVPVSDAVRAGDHLYLSGQLGVDHAAGTLVAGAFVDEARRAFRNVFDVLDAAGYVPDEVTYLDVALTDLDDAPALDELWRELFPATARPARSTFEVSRLPAGGRVRISGVAVRRSRLERCCDGAGETGSYGSQSSPPMSQPTRQ